MNFAVSVLSIYYMLALLLPQDQIAAINMDRDVHVRMLSRRSISLQVQGKLHHVKVGEKSPEGVEVLKADSSQATLRYLDQTRTVGLSIVPVRQQQSLPRPVASAIIQRHPDSHYYASGEINNNPVRMMVDTGASLIAMNSDHARSLGLDLENARLTQVATAAGAVDAYRSAIASIRVGEIVREDVPVVVIAGDSPRVILLGNSFLSTLQMREEGDVLTLTSPY